MKKSTLIKFVSILLISVMVMMFSTNVFAATELSLPGSTSGNNTQTNTPNNTSDNTPSNASKNNISNNTSNGNTNRNSNSIYNNTNLPKTGIEDSIPVAMLVVVFGISAVYAYKKIKDYRNV